MDSRLKNQLDSWQNHIEVLSKVEEKYFSLEASEKSYLATLTLKQEGKSQAAKECLALSTPDWVTFKKGLSVAKADYLKSRRLLEIKQKAFDAEYITYKIESNAVSRG